MYEIEGVVVLVGGIYNLAFGIYHLMFWKLFKWKEDLKNIHLVNRGIMQILKFVVSLFYFL